MPSLEEHPRPLERLVNPTTLAFVSTKGGVGKTTSTGALAACLARRGVRVLACDLDPSANLTTLLGLRRYVQPGLTAAHVLEDHRLDPHRALLDHPTLPLSLLPGDNYMIEVTSGLTGKVGWEQRLLRQLRRLQDRFEWILLDTHGGLGPTTTSALLAADLVVVPAKAEAFSYQAGQEVAAYLVELHEQGVRVPERVEGVLFVDVDRRLVLSRQAFEQQDQSGVPRLPVFIPRGTAVESAAGYRSPITLLEPDHPASQAYEQLAEYLLGRDQQAVAA
jgi:chromosome partitioning protein